MGRTILDVARECDNFAHDELMSHSEGREGCYAFKVNGCDATLGYIIPDIVERIQWSPTWSINHRQRTVILATPATATADLRSRALEDTLNNTRQQGTVSLLQNWRNETFPVYGTRGELLLEIERCASALFGIVTYGVQLICYIRSENGPQIWIGRRAETKQTYPGMLDSTAAGGLGTGKIPIEAIISEAYEEASIAEGVMRANVKPMKPLSYFHVRGGKAGGESGLFQPEVEYAYELELDPDFVPRPGDSEVECFSLFTVNEVFQALTQGLFKPNSAVVVIEFLIQHGILTQENEPSYFDILSHLYRQLKFPILIQPSL